MQQNTPTLRRGAAAAVAPLNQRHKRPTKVAIDALCYPFETRILHQSPCHGHGQPFAEPPESWKICKLPAPWECEAEMPLKWCKKEWAGGRVYSSDNSGRNSSGGGQLKGWQALHGIELRIRHVAQDTVNAAIQCIGTIPTVLLILFLV